MREGRRDGERAEIERETKRRKRETERRKDGEDERWGPDNPTPLQVVRNVFVRLKRQNIPPPTQRPIWLQLK